MYGKQIIDKFRNEAVTDSKYANAPTFKEFITFLVNTPVSVIKLKRNDFKLLKSSKT